MEPIYLDYNATTPVAPEVLEAMMQYLNQDFGNPSSAHVYGRRAKAGVEDARQAVAELLGTTAESILCTSGGTESNNLAIQGVALSDGGARRHLITSAVEHPAVREVMTWLAGRAGGHCASAWRADAFRRCPEHRQDPRLGG